MTQVTITEFRNNIKKYADYAQEHDFEVINRGKVVFVVKSLKSYKDEVVERLYGAAKTDIPYEEILKGKTNKL